MPKDNSAGIDIEFSRPLSLRSALEALVADGWNPTIDGAIQFLPPRSASRMGWEQKPDGCWPAVLTILEENHGEGGLNRLVMRFARTPFVAVFEFFQDGDITVDCGPLRPRLTHCCGFTDTNWLLSHVAAPLANGGALIDKVCFSEVSFTE